MLAAWTNLNIHIKFFSSLRYFSYRFHKYAHRFHVFAGWSNSICSIRHGLPTNCLYLWMRLTLLLLLGLSLILETCSYAEMCGIDTGALIRIRCDARTPISCVFSTAPKQHAHIMSYFMDPYHLIMITMIILKLISSALKHCEVGGGHQILDVILEQRWLPAVLMWTLMYDIRLEMNFNFSQLDVNGVCALGVEFLFLCHLMVSWDAISMLLNVWYSYSREGIWIRSLRGRTYLRLFA